jgi:hypothetical protein
MGNRTLTISGRYDGRVIIPDQLLQLEPGTTVAISFESPAKKSSQARLSALKEYLARPMRPLQTSLSDEMTRREHIYGDAGR